MSNSNNEHRYRLLRWSERDRSLRCPNCGRRGYKEYLDTWTMEVVDPTGHTVGKCDHENSCGYHVTPKQYLCGPGQGKGISSSNHGVNAYRQDKPRKMITIANKDVSTWVNQTLRVGNNLTRWIQSLPMANDQKSCIRQLLGLYLVGTTNDGRVIWFQCDETNTIRTGKVMAYDDNGHRLKDEDGNSIGFGWIHAILRRQFKMFLPEDEWELKQCLFGQHLLSIFPDAEVHLVESEKTAILMTILDRELPNKHLWVAVGGKQQLNDRCFETLRGRRVIYYPDCDAREAWRQMTKGQKNWHESTKWMSLMSDKDSPKSDIADVMVRRLLERHDQIVEEGKKEGMCEDILNLPIVKMLIEKLDCEIISTKHEDKEE